MATPPDAATGRPAESARLQHGDLLALFRDNAASPGTLSGLQSLFNIRDAPDFDAYDPDSPGASAGLNFEHIIAGHENPHNAFAPRHGRYTLDHLDNGRAVRLVRRAEDSPWHVASTMTYTLTEPHYIDFEFRCRFEKPQLFAPHGYALMFWANYMNDVADAAIRFWGVPRLGDQECWIDADAPPGHPDWNQGGTYRSLPARDLPCDDDTRFRLNTWAYDWPRFSKPFYYGLTDKGLVYQLMFDRMHGPDDEIRFALFKFKLASFPRPAWDFQYVVRNVEKGREYGFRGRVMFKRFVSREDCLREYEVWAAGLDRQTRQATIRP